MSLAVVKVSSKGQLTLPVKIRRELASDTLAVVFERGAIKMRPLVLADFMAEKTGDDEADLLRASVQNCKFWENSTDRVWDQV